MTDWWSWVLTAGFLTVLWLTGKKLRVGWMLGVCLQGLWVAYALETKQYGFLFSALIIGVMYWRNWMLWKPERMEAEDD